MNALDGFVDSLLAAAENKSPFAVGVVASVAAGAAADGNAKVVVNYRGTAVAAAYAASYTPAVGHVVFMARVGPQLVILCRLIGTPS